MIPRRVRSTFSTRSGIWRPSTGSWRTMRTRTRLPAASWRRLPQTPRARSRPNRRSQSTTSTVRRWYYLSFFSFFLLFLSSSGLRFAFNHFARISQLCVPFIRRGHVLPDTSRWPDADRCLRSGVVPDSGLQVSLVGLTSNVSQSGAATKSAEDVFFGHTTWRSYYAML